MPCVDALPEPKIPMSIQLLKNTLPQLGNVTWIGIRPERRAALVTAEAIEAITDRGLAGDHYNGKPGAQRQVSLIQAEHIEAIASFMELDPIDPGLLRRNIVVQGINLLALRERRFAIGDAILEGTVLCHPCSRMEENLGAGGYNAMRGHGGLCARVLQGGAIRVGSQVQLLPDGDVVDGDAEDPTDEEL